MSSTESESSRPNVLAVADNPVTVIVADNHERQVRPIENLDDLLGQWCVVRYEGRIYPGIVLGTEGNDIEVKCMSVAGKNRFYWPSRDDRCWYSSDNVVGCIPEPQKVGSRHMEIHPELWENIELGELSQY